LFLEKHKFEPKQVASFFLDNKSSPFFIITQKKPLPFWIYALTHVIEEDGVYIPFLEVSEKKIPFAPSFEEISAHEKIHLMRAHFNEPRFEEILAYQTSPSFFRRFFGPLFQNIKESYAFIFISFLFPLIAFLESEYLYIIPIFFISFLFLRLFVYQYFFKKTKRVLCKNYRSVEMIIPLLTDKEILYLAIGKNIKKDDLRWKIIEIIGK
jgi:hypothetical protein